MAFHKEYKTQIHLLYSSYIYIYTMQKYNSIYGHSQELSCWQRMCETNNFKPLIV